MCPVRRVMALGPNLEPSLQRVLSAKEQERYVSNKDFLVLQEPVTAAEEKER